MIIFKTLIEIHLWTRSFTVSMHCHVHRDIHTHAWIMLMPGTWCWRIVVAVWAIAILRLVLMTLVVMVVRWGWQEDLRMMNSVRETVWVASVVLRWLEWVCLVARMCFAVGFQNSIFQWQKNIGNVMRRSFGSIVIRWIAWRKRKKTRQRFHFKRWQSGEWTHFVVPVTRMRTNGLCETLNTKKKNTQKISMELLGKVSVSDYAVGCKGVKREWKKWRPTGEMRKSSWKQVDEFTVQFLCTNFPFDWLQLKCSFEDE